MGLSKKKSHPTVPISNGTNKPTVPRISKEKHLPIPVYRTCTAVEPYVLQYRTAVEAAYIAYFWTPVLFSIVKWQIPSPRWDKSDIWWNNIQNDIL